LRSSGGKESNLVLLWGGLLVLFLFITAFSLFRFIVLLKAPLEKKGILVVSEGENASSVIKKINPDGKEFYIAAKLYLILTGKDKSLRPCSIGLSEKDNFLVVIDKIVNYREPLVRVVIFEGMDSFEIAELFENLNLKEESRRFLQKVLASKLEGYLFPDTYFLSKYRFADTFVAMAVHNFEQRAEALLKQAHLLSPYETLILASIIQKETYMKEEMPVIAGVFYNRLKRGMPLQADPTVIYALKLIKRKNIDLRLSRKDLEVDSPYNTYRYKGLPPTPICNPGIDAIRAAVYPAKTDYLYFVSKGNGTHAFARTLEEHYLNVERYRKR